MKYYGFVSITSVFPHYHNPDNDHVQCGEPHVPRELAQFLCTDHNWQGSYITAGQDTGLGKAPGMLWLAQWLQINSLFMLLLSHAAHAIWWHRSRSTLAQVMACCLAAPSHYLIQCWLKIIGFRPSIINFMENVYMLAKIIIFKVIFLAIFLDLPGDNKLLSKLSKDFVQDYLSPVHLQWKCHKQPCTKQVDWNITSKSETCFRTLMGFSSPGIRIFRNQLYEVMCVLVISNMYSCYSDEGDFKL